MTLRSILAVLTLALSSAPTFGSQGSSSYRPASPSTGLSRILEVPVGLGADGLTDEQRDFLRRASGLYYRYQGTGVRRIQCKVDIPRWRSFVFQNAFQEYRTKRWAGLPLVLDESLDDVEFILGIDIEKGVSLKARGFKGTPDKKKDRMVRREIQEARDEALKLMQFWGGLAGWGGKEPEKRPLRMVKKGSGYEVSMEVKGETWVYTLSEKGLVTGCRVPPDPGEETADLRFDYERTTEGHLLKSISFARQGESPAWSLEMKYKVHEGVWLPRSVEWRVDPDRLELGERASGVFLTLRDLEVDGVAVGDPEGPKPYFSFDTFELMPMIFDGMIRNGIVFHLGFGPQLSSTPRLQETSGSYNGSIGMGWGATRNLSFSVEYQGVSFSEKGSGPGRLNLMQIMLSGKYRPFTGPVRPYLRAGAGIGRSSWSPNGELDDETMKEEGFVADAGLGLEVRVSGNMFIYAQTQWVHYEMSKGYAQAVGADSPSGYVPIQFGIAFER